jgi:hypothetical protein
MALCGPLMDAACNYMSATAFALVNLDDEVTRARRAIPICEDAYAALLEELGELANALIEHKYRHAPARNVRAEALQVACVAVRIGSEGDVAYGVAPAADVRQTTVRLGHLACERIEHLRAIAPGNRYALVQLAHAVTKIGEYLVRSQERVWCVTALESAAVHVVAWALRIAIEGDAAFPYAAPAEWRG